MSSKWVSLTDRLVRMTREGKLDWQETSDDSSFQVIVGKNAIELEETGFGEDFEFRIRDGSGKIVDRFSDQELTVQTGEFYHKILGETFRLIRRQISGSEKVLDDLLKELDEDSE